MATGLCSFTLASERRLSPENSSESLKGELLLSGQRFDTGSPIELGCIFYNCLIMRGSYYHERFQINRPDITML
jgi:hypothetical protein